MTSPRQPILALAGCALLAACGPGKRSPSAEEQPASAYTQAPEPRAAAAGPAGSVVLSGVSRPGALIRLASPGGDAIGATADTAGAWSLNADLGGQPHLYSLSEDAGGRPLRARGYIVALPAPAATAAMLRPGTSAVPLRPSRRLEIASVDFDGGGAAVVGGAAKPGDAVRLELDGAESGEDRADNRGAFTVSLPEVLKPGPHTLVAVTPSGRSEVGFDAAPAAPLAQPPFAAARAGDAWRIDWMTPGGGVQTTLLFDAPGASR